MDRRHLDTGLIVAGVVVIAAAWWFAGHTGFQPTVKREVVIAGTVYEVTRWVGVEAPGEPEKARACFRVKDEIQAPPELEPRPTPGPTWLRCFSPDFIMESLATDDGTAYVAEYDDPPGWNRIVAVVSGRRAFMWHQPQP